MISIVVPTKNEENYLPNLLSSLKKQTFQDFEVIVADAGSSDQTVRLAEESGAKVVLGGLPAVGRNSGAVEAKGEILFFLDADVVLTDDFLAKAQKEFLEARGDFATVLMDPIEKNFFNKLAHGFGNFFLWLFQFFSPITPGFCIIAKADFFKQVLFDQEVKILEDLKFGRDASKRGKFVLIRSARIGVSDRRMKKEGWLVTSIRTVLMIGYVLIFGFSKANPFNYQFRDYR